MKLKLPFSVLLGLLAAWVGTMPALAAPVPPPSLLGESFTVMAAITGASCTAGAGSFSFVASGTAAGPYTGSFRETGNATIGGAAQNSWTAGFEIRSPQGHVTGTIVHGGVPFGFAGYFCAPAGTGTFYVVHTQFFYQASIHGHGGRFRDSGSGNFEILATLPGPSGSGDFQEFFNQSNGITPASGLK